MERLTNKQHYLVRNKNQSVPILGPANSDVVCHKSNKKILPMYKGRVKIFFKKFMENSIIWGGRGVSEGHFPL